MLCWISGAKRRKKGLLQLLVGASLAAHNVDGNGDVDVDARGKDEAVCAISGKFGSASKRNIVRLAKALYSMFDWK